MLKKGIMLGAIILMAGMLAGCGTSNLFASLAGSAGDTTKAKNALDNGDYAVAKETANKILVSDPNNKDALRTRGSATLGEQGVTITAVVANMATVTAEVTGESLSSFDKIQKAIPNASPEAVSAAAIDLIKASPEAKEDKMTAGVASGVAAALLIEKAFDTNQSGEITTKEIDSMTTDDIRAKWLSINSDTSGNFSTGEGSATYFVDNSAKYIGEASPDADTKNQMTTVNANIVEINRLYLTNTLDPTTFKNALKK